MVPVIRLDGDGQADVFGRFPGRGGGVHQGALGHRNTAGLEQAFGQVFVAGDFFSDGAGLVGFGGPDAALCDAITQLYQIAFGQANVGNAAVCGGIHNIGGAGPQAQRIHHVTQSANLGCQVVRRVVDGG